MSERPKRNDLSDEPALWVAVCVLAALLCGVLILQVQEMRAQRRIRSTGEGHARMDTLNVISKLAVATMVAVDISGKQSPVEMHLLLEFIHDHCPNWLEFVAESGGGLQGRRLLDSWGTPIELVVQSPSSYTLISLGPNGMSDNGKGDDIVFTFDPRNLEREKDDTEN